MNQRPLLFSVLLLSPVASIHAQDRAADQLLPETTILYAEIPQPPELFATIFDHPLRTKIEALEPYKQATQTDGYIGFLAGRKFVELQLGMEWREALETLTANGVYFGIDSATNGLAVLIRAKNAESLDLFRTKLLAIVQLGKNPDQIKEGEYRGITAYEINKSKFAIVDNWLLITNQNETGKIVLDRLIDRKGPSLADNETYQTARKSYPADSSAWGFANLKTLRDAGAVRKLFAGESENPVGELLVGGVLSSLQHTPFATAQLNAATSGLGLTLSIPHKPEWVPEEREYFFGPDGSGSGPQIPAAKDTLFTLSTFRNVAEMWLRAGDLFNEQINDGFAEADANLTTFFSGKDFGEDILGALTPQIGFIATKQDFTNILPRPAIKLPQFALVLEMKEPETMTRELRRTFQSMIGFFNVVGAMEGRAQLEMNMDRLDNGAQLITSTYIPEDDDAASTRADLIFNFSPSVAFAKERVIVSSTDRLARELVSWENQPVEERGTPANTEVNLQAGVLRSVLSDNEEQLISQNMLEEGNSREEAALAIGLFLEFIGYFEDASITLNTSPDELAVEFDLRVQGERAIRK